MATTQKAVEKWKSKRWFNVHAPKLLGEGVIGEIPSSDESNVVGRVIKVSLSWITQNPAHSFMTVGLKVNGVNGDVAQTELKCLEQVYSYTHSLIRRDSSSIYTVDRLKDKEGKGLVLKLILITRSKVATPKKRMIRKEISRFVSGYVATRSIEEFVKAVIENRFQMEAARIANRLAPIGKLDVKKIEL